MEPNQQMKRLCCTILECVYLHVLLSEILYEFKHINFLRMKVKLVLKIESHTSAQFTRFFTKQEKDI